ncbi:clathrin interactor 1-like isoform X3 [Mercenaria mercenaria]|uniref:clathrin interactor 1-like isoform X3 n=1 Tax=Mercenaria mercenaria TaxID=6596 RepID=UPI00234F9636|nr:clathrin interactor 1-like isoform X3 [Mercenaria mercenaria]
MWKIKEITDKVTNVVMNYSEVETKVREATNDEAWGPHGQICSEIAQYTFTYEHFPEVMGMLWKRMYHDNKKSWRRTYKSLTLLTYLIRNGSERVVTAAREHLYDLRGLENYTFTDEFGKDQGLNVRHKAKDIVELIQNDERLREERKKAKKNKDKYQGMAGDSMNRFSYSDRYDEKPRSKEDRLGEIDEWQDGKKSVVEDAVDKVKDLWNRAHGRRAPDETVDYSDETDHNNRIGDDDFEFKDNNSEEYTYHERTETTKTEKITSKRRSGGKQQIDLGAAANQLKGTQSDLQSVTSSTSRSTLDNGPNLLDMGNPVGGGSDSTADFADFQSAGNDFNPRANSEGTKTDDFADFSTAPISNATSQNGGFADFSQVNSSHSVSQSSANTNSSDLFDVFSAKNSSMQSSVPLQPNVNNMNNMAGINSMNNQGLMGNMSGANVPNMGMQQGMMGNQPNMMGQTNLMGGPNTMMSSQPNMMSSQPGMMSPQPNMMSQQPNMMSQQPNTMNAGMMGMPQPMVQQGMMGGMNQQKMGMMGNPGMMGNMSQPVMQPQSAAMGFNQGMGMMQPNAAPKQDNTTSDTQSSTVPTSTQNTEKQNSANTWSTDAGKVNISLEALSPASKYQQQHKPSMNQLQTKGMMSPPANQGMGNITQGMAGMNMGGQPMMSGMAMGMSTQAGYGMQGSVMTPGGSAVRMQTTMNVQNTMVGGAAFQQRTDNAFAAFGGMK